MKHKILSLLGLIVLAMFVMHNPTGAADLATGLMNGLGKLADSLGQVASHVNTGGGQ